MAYAQRSFEKSVDERVLAASPADLEALQAIDRRAQISGSSFYDAYLDNAGGTCRAGGAPAVGAAARPAVSSPRCGRRRGRRGGGGRGGGAAASGAGAAGP